MRNETHAVRPRLAMLSLSVLFAALLVDHYVL